MTNAWTLLTAMPPTVGHAALLDFTSQFGPLRVVLATQPHEPDVEGRENALFEAVFRRLGKLFIHGDVVEQNPDTPGFREMWRDKFIGYGFKAGDYLVTSEIYGSWLAEMLGGVWVPFDIQRSLVPIRATPFRRFRHEVLNLWAHLMPEYQQQTQKRITFFGAESTGKSAGAQALRLAALGRGNTPKLLSEWARPYLEAVGPEVTNEKMEIIFKGQEAIQQMARRDASHPIVIQDTDLFSTIGYWRMYDPKYYAANRLYWIRAMRLASDLYVVCPSDIPFEPDQLRYGGDKRESTDQYWIDLLEEFGLNYIVWDRNVSNLYERVREMFPDLRYDRNGY